MRIWPPALVDQGRMRVRRDSLPRDGTVIQSCVSSLEAGTGLNQLAVRISQAARLAVGALRSSVSAFTANGCDPSGACPNAEHMRDRALWRRHHRGGARGAPTRKRIAQLPLAQSSRRPQAQEQLSPAANVLVRS